MSKEFEIAREFEVDATPEEVWEADHRRHRRAGCGRWRRPSRGSAAGALRLRRSPPGTRRTGTPTASRTSRASPSRPSTSSTHASSRATTAGGPGCGTCTAASSSTTGTTSTTAPPSTPTSICTPCAQYLTHFAGRPVRLRHLRRARGVQGPRRARRRRPGARARRTTPPQGARGAGRGARRRLLDAVVDYRNPYFIGLRTDDALYPLLRPQPLGLPGRRQRPRLRAGRRRRGERDRLAGLAERRVQPALSAVGCSSAVAAGLRLEAAAPAGRGR